MTLIRQMFLGCNKIRATLFALMLCLFSYGAGAEVDQAFKGKIAILEAEVAKGNARAEYHLGNILLEGISGWPMDKQRGIKLLTSAAEAGIPDANTT